MVAGDSPGLPHRCPDCNKPLEFWTDGMGHVTVSHPRSPCVKPVHWSVPLPVCAVCGGEVPAGRPGPYRKTCKSECHELFVEKERAAARLERMTKSDRLRYYWRKKYAAKREKPDEKT